MTESWEKLGVFRWSKRKAQAAVNVAEDRLADVEIARRAGVTEEGLRKWKHHPEFAARVSEHVEVFRQAVLARGIADKMQRVQEMDDRWQALKAVRMARAADLIEVPGGDTGLLVRQGKLVKVYEAEDNEDDGESYLRSAKREVMIFEYPLDTGMLAEMRQLEKQAAQEVGQWVEKVAPTNSQGGDLDLASMILGLRDQPKAADS